MTSYVPLLLKGNVYPIKVGGKTKDEPQTPMSKETEARLIKAFKEGDKKTLKELEAEVNQSAIADIRTAWEAWIPKEISYLVPFSTKELSFVIGPNQILSVPVKQIKKYGKPPEKQTKEPTAKLAPFEVLRGPKESDASYAKRLEANRTEDRMPFRNLNLKTIWEMLENGLMLVDRYSNSRKLKRKQQITLKNRANTTIPGHIPCTCYVEVTYPDKIKEIHIFKHTDKLVEFSQKVCQQGAKILTYHPYDDGFVAGYKSGKQTIDSYSSEKKITWKKEGVDYLSSMLNPMQSGYGNKDMDKDYLAGFENGFKQSWLEQVNQTNHADKERVLLFSDNFIIDEKDGKYSVFNRKTSRLKGVSDSLEEAKTYVEHEEKKKGITTKFESGKRVSN